MSLLLRARSNNLHSPSNTAGFPDRGKVPDARQPLSVDRSLVLYRSTCHRQLREVLRGWSDGLARAVRAMPESAMRDITTSKQSSQGKIQCSVLLCWHCDNKLRDEPDPVIKEIVSRNVIDSVIDMVPFLLGCTWERTLSPVETVLVGCSSLGF